MTLLSTPKIARDYAFYRRVFAGRRLPLAYVDLDLLDANAAQLSQRARPLKMRLATKSLRCVSILRYLLDRYPAFSGLMAYSPAEAAFLADQGFDDLLLGYPTMESSEILPCIDWIRRGKWLAFMVDDPRQIALLEALAASGGAVQVPVCIDLDLSMDLPGLRFGVFRSPIQALRQAEPLLSALAKAPHLQLQGLMGYEAQLAGIADAIPKSGLYNRMILLLKALSQRQAFNRRQTLVRQLHQRSFPLRLINGGGTGSIDRTRLDPSVTELTVGSGLYAPALFDHYREFHYQPAAGFALPVVRQAAPGIYACSGGGYVASGPTHADKQPEPYLPPGMSLIKTLGAGEVQTSLRSPVPLELGDPVFMRHAKAGELCERFDSLYLLRQGEIDKVVSTYRGQGTCFF